MLRVFPSSMECHVKRVKTQKISANKHKAKLKAKRRRQRARATGTA